MAVIPTLWLIAGLACTVLGLVTWRSGGRNLTLVGAVNAGFGGSILLWDSTVGWRYPALGVLAILVLTALAMTPREAWRRARLELLLAGATILAIWVSYFLTDIPVVVQNALLVLVGVLATAFVATMLVRTVGMLRAASRPRRVEW